MYDTETEQAAPRRLAPRWKVLVAVTAVLVVAMGLTSAPASAATFDVSYGQTIEGSISFPGEQNTYRFNATSGDRLSIQWQSGSGQMRMRLLAPNGNVIWNDVAFSNNVVTLPSAGQYQLVFSFGTSPSTGNYRFAINNVRNPQSHAVGYGTTISNGVPSAGMGNIELPGGADRYTFTAKQGDRLSIQWKSGSGQLRMRLLAPNGSVIWNDVAFSNNVVTLPSAGQYQLIFSYGTSPTTGTYSFAINEVRYSQTFAVAAPISISNGVPRAGMGNIELPGWKDLYRFQGTAGHNLSIHWKSGSGQLRMRLRAPSGRIIWNDVSFANRTVNLPETGQYDLFFSYGTSPATGTYAYDMNIVK